MDEILGPMVDGLPPEVADVKPEHAAAAERLVAARGRMEVARGVQLDAADRRQAAAEIGILAVELDGRVEAADGFERRAAQREIAAIEDGPDPQHVLRGHVRERRQRVVVDPRAKDADPVPVVEPVRPCHGDGPRRPQEAALHALHEPERRPAVRVDVN